MNQEQVKVVHQFELETWSRCASSYLDTFAGLTSQMLPKLIEVAGVTAGQSVLDLGCGPGNSSAAFKNAGAKVVGIDFSDQMLTAAKTSNPGIEYKKSYLEELPEDDATFDVVLSNYVVHHLPEPTKVLKEVARVLKPGGHFAFAVWGGTPEQSSLGAFIGAISAHFEMAELPHGPLFGVTDKEVFAKMCEDAGLSDFELTNHEVAWKVDTLAPVIDGLWTWGNCALFPQDLQDKIRGTMVENCSAFGGDGGYSFPHTAIMGHARKK